MAPILVINAGSSTLKYQVVDPLSGEPVVKDLLERIGEGDLPDHAAALDRMVEGIEDHGVAAESLQAVGHRVVHGGPHLTAPTLIDDDVARDIEAAAHLAPLHNPPALAGIRNARTRYPNTPQVAVFDTGFFADLPAAAATYAIDTGLAVRHRIRRYGFHGISHQYVAQEAAASLGRPVAQLNQIVLHLGNGASASAVRGGQPVDTSMGLTPLEGLVMGTRGGDLDPGVLLYLSRHAGFDNEALDELLHRRSGLQGLVGHADFRELERALDAGDPQARMAYDIYCHRIRKYVGAYLAVLGGADTIVFTAGVGEHAPQLRRDVLAGLEAFGIEVEDERNRAPADGTRRISPDDARVAVLVVPTNEELAIARAAADLTGS